MTKRNLTLGSASGKLGSVVYMRRRGQQIARLLVSSPRDPRTLSQCGNRASFANYVNHWRAIRAFVGPSWSGVSRYGSRENAFYRHNRSNMPAISQPLSRDGSFLPCLGLVSYGSLPVAMGYAMGYHLRFTDSAERASVILTNTAGQQAPTTVEGLLSKLKAAATGIADGDVFHVMLYSWYTDWSTTGFQFVQEWPSSVTHSSVVLTTTNNTQITSALPDVTFHTATAPDGTRYLSMRPNASRYPASSGGRLLLWAMAIWIERPSARGTAKHTRGRWAISQDLYSNIDSSMKGGSWYERIAGTYR